MPSVIDGKISDFRSLILSGADHVSMLDEISDFFIHNQQKCSKQEKNEFGEMITQLLSSQANDKKIEFAEKFADLKNAPLKVIRFLALEPVEIAKKVLSRSPILDDKDLLVVIKIRSFAHMAAIAIRKIVSEIVSIELVKRGNDDVLVKLAANSGACLSDEALTLLKDKSEENRSLLNCLLSRSDIPVRLMRQISDGAKKATRAFHPQNNNPDLLAYLDENQLEENDLADDFDFEEMQGLSNTFIENKTGLQVKEKDLISALKEEDFVLVVVFFSFLTKLPLDYCYNLFKKRDETAIAILSRAIDLQRKTLVVLLKVDSLSTMISDERRKKALAVFDAMKVEAASKILSMRYRNVGKLILKK